MGTRANGCLVCVLPDVLGYIYIYIYAYIIYTLFICMYYVYIYIYVYIYTHMYTYIRILHIYTHITYINIYTYVHVYVQFLTVNVCFSGGLGTNWAECFSTPNKLELKYMNRTSNELTNQHQKTAGKHRYSLHRGFGNKGFRNRGNVPWAHAKTCAY